MMWYTTVQISRFLRSFAAQRLAVLENKPPVGAPAGHHIAQAVPNRGENAAASRLGLEPLECARVGHGGGCLA